MWNRKELKEKAKAAFKANYWPSVLVAIILTIVVGACAGYVGSTSANTVKKSGQTTTQSTVTVDGKEYTSDELATKIENDINNLSDDEKGALATALGMITGGLVAAIVIAALVNIFVIRPIEVGCKAFFIKNTETKAEIGELSKGFKPSWMRNVGSLFLMGLYETLWAMLFIIPGIIKAYSYRMVPYILAEDPEIGANDAITRSREMMNGHKWNAFVLDLSFIGWELLSALTFGILSIFYVNPYIYQTDAELYKALKG